MGTLESLRWARAGCVRAAHEARADARAALSTDAVRLRSGGEIAAQLVQDTAGIAPLHETPRPEVTPPSAEADHAVAPASSPQERRCRVPGCSSSLESRYSIRTRCAHSANNRRSFFSLISLTARLCGDHMRAEALTFGDQTLRFCQKYAPAPAPRCAGRRRLLQHGCCACFRNALRLPSLARRRPKAAADAARACAGATGCTSWRCSAV